MNSLSFPWMTGGSSRQPLRVFLLALLSGIVVAVGALSPNQAAAQGLPDFTELVERVGPAVVNIRTTERVRSPRGGGGGFELDEDMLEFFRRFGIPIPGMPGTPGQPPRRGGPPMPEGEPQQRGVGSGFILTADGFVMTNAHVVEGADDVLVTLTDKREFKARVIGSDKRTDVALVKIEATGLPFVRIGDVSRLKVGEWVMAIGSPFGLDNTVTAGIVSAKARDTGEFLPFIQTDVAINPGNSGGPLINLRGEVVGINSQIYSRSGGFMGISFAIPIDEAIRVSDQLRTTGRVIRGRIGVQISPVTKEVAESIGLGKAGGALVQSVEPGGPADKGGVEAGDIITRVEGRIVEKSGDLPRIIGNTKPGQKLTLQVFRRGSFKDLPVTVVEFDPPETKTRSAAAEPSKNPAPMSAIGVAVSDLTEAQKRELKVKSGVRIETVEGAAARAGLREGDVIMALDNIEVTSARQFETIVAKLDKSKPVTALVRRGEWVNYVVIRPLPR
ncbi:Do family serine endopeptidase [Piscinibacter sakaiensis]|uniref:Do family serine endopeptidase n=1 Tax=Piscinibacter sakaiensis TaxID=1547922 RepID=UPI003AAAB154